MSLEAGLVLTTTSLNGACRNLKPLCILSRQVVNCQTLYLWQNRHLKLWTVQLTKLPRASPAAECTAQSPSRCLNELPAMTFQASLHSRANPTRLKPTVGPPLQVRLPSGPNALLLVTDCMSVERTSSSSTTLLPLEAKVGRCHDGVTAILTVGLKRAKPAMPPLPEQPTTVGKPRCSMKLLKAHNSGGQHRQSQPSLSSAHRPRRP